MLRDRDIRPRFRVQRRWRAIKLRMGVYYDNIVRVGKVSSVDVNGRMVRVAFEDKLDTEGKPLISGKLKVLQNQPLITVEKWVEELGTENKWDYEAYYNSQGRGLNLGEPQEAVPLYQLSQKAPLLHLTSLYLREIVAYRGLKATQERQDHRA